LSGGSALDPGKARIGEVGEGQAAAGVHCGNADQKR
jgi:hypothetical protein